MLGGSISCLCRTGIQINSKIPFPLVDMMAVCFKGFGKDKGEISGFRKGGEGLVKWLWPRHALFIGEGGRGEKKRELQFLGGI